MGAFIFGKKTIYPYVHFHFSHYQTDSDYIKGITMFQSAYNQASNNAHSNYIQQNYNTAQLQALENVFGQLNLYFPSTWRLQVNKQSVFGGVKICGRPCTDPDAPVIHMNAESVFGNITIFFE